MKPVLLGIAVFCVAVAAVAIFAPRPISHHVLIIGDHRIDYADLDPSSEIGAERLLRRIRFAAGQTCGVVRVPRRRSRIEQDECLRQVIDPAVEQAGPTATIRYRRSG